MRHWTLNNDRFRENNCNLFKRTPIKRMKFKLFVILKILVQNKRNQNWLFNKNENEDKEIEIVFKFSSMEM